MAVSVRADVLRASSWSEAKGFVNVIRRTFVVDGLTPNPSADGLLADALNTSGVPQPQEAHPTFGNMLAHTRRAEPITPTKVEVSVEYRPLTFGSGQPIPPPPGVWYSVDVGTDLAEEETNKDRRTDTEITVTHDNQTVGATVRVRVPRPTIRISGTITGRLGEYVTISDMTAFRRLYVGKANETGWYGDTTAPRKRWLMTSMAIGLDGQTSTVPAYAVWSVEMTFESYEEDEYPSYGEGNAGPCDPQAVWIDPATGQPGAGLQIDQGYKWIDWYDTVSFNAAIDELDGGPG